MSRLIFYVLIVVVVAVVAVAIGSAMADAFNAVNGALS